MTQIAVTIEDISMYEQLKQAISQLKGVIYVSLKQTQRNGMDRAIDDIKNGRVYSVSSVDDFLKQCKA